MASVYLAYPACLRACAPFVSSEAFLSVFFVIGHTCRLSRPISLLTSALLPPCFEQEKPLAAKPPSSSTLNWLSTPSTRGQARSVAPFDGVHRIRVDFKRDHDVEKVWEAGGLSLLTSVPVTPRVLCFLCASSGNVEVRKETLSLHESPGPNLFLC